MIAMVNPDSMAVDPKDSKHGCQSQKEKSFGMINISPLRRSADKKVTHGFSTPEEGCYLQ
jgi:hypothetical protein